METLHDRLAGLAEGAPTGGPPAAHLWARGRRAHRLRAAALATVVLVLVAFGAGIAVRLVDGDGNRDGLAPAATHGITLPIQYPVGDEPPDLGAAPGPLAAIWVDRVGGGVPRAVGLVAKTGTFGTLPFDPPYSDEWPDVGIALSPDGRRMAYTSPTRHLIVRDLVSGRLSSPAFPFAFRDGYTWVDATHLVGHVAEGSDIDGWVWGLAGTPKPVNLLTYPGSPWLGSYGGRDPWFQVEDSGSRPCSSPTVSDNDVPVLCDVLGVVGSEIVLTHVNSEVVALDRADRPLDRVAKRRVVIAAGSPQRVAFAAGLIGAALAGDGGTS